MKKIILSTLVAGIALLAACHSSKKTSSNTASKPANGVYAPGEAELAAIKKQDPEMSMGKLQEGYTLYTGISCTKCHGAKNIYQYSETEWKWLKKQKSTTFKKMLYISMYWLSKQLNILRKIDEDYKLEMPVNF